MMSNDVILRASGISKRFEGVRALSGVDFDLKRGEVKGLVGENGAGKTTFVNILYGIVKNDSGELEIKDTRYRSINPTIAKKEGISMIPQHIQLVPELTIAENEFLIYLEQQKVLYYPRGQNLPL